MFNISTFRGAAFALMLACFASCSAFAQQQQHDDQPARVLKAADKDNDGTITLDEAKQAASARFDRLDTDHDLTLTFEEFEGSSTPKPSKHEFNFMNKDSDKTVSKSEYLSEIERLFAKINVDKDGTLDVKELRTSSGRVLAALLD